MDRFALETALIHIAIKVDQTHPPHERKKRRRLFQRLIAESGIPKLAQVALDYSLDMALAKGYGDPATLAGILSEAAARRLIERTFPAHD